MSCYYLSGVVRSSMFGRYPWLGWMLQPGMGNRLPWEETWAADNGCFAHPEKFQMSAFLRWLGSRNRETCLFATAPDRLGDWETTLQVAEPELKALRADGWKAALVAQDGLRPEMTPWGAFDVLFIGGTTSWKLGVGAETLIREAIARGVWVHVGRVNSYRRFKSFHVNGVNSVDGTFLRFEMRSRKRDPSHGPAAGPALLASWLNDLGRQSSLFRDAEPGIS